MNNNNMELFGSSASPPALYSSPMYRPMYSAPGYPPFGTPRFLETGIQVPVGTEDESDSNRIMEQNSRFMTRIQYLEDEINRKKSTIDGLQNQLSKYEQEKQAEKKKQSRYWTPEEHSRFIDALKKFGHKDVKAISQYVATRNPTQVRTHAQKYFLRIDRERQRKLESKDGNGDRDGDELFWDRTGSFDDTYGGNGDDSPLHTPSLNSPTSMGTPTNPFAMSPNIIKRKRDSVTITATQAKSAPTHKDAMLKMLQQSGVSWTSNEYDGFARGLLSSIDQDDTHTLFKMIRDNFLKNYSIDTIELAYNTYLKVLEQAKLNLNGNNSNGNNMINQNINGNIYNGNHQQMNQEEEEEEEEEEEDQSSSPNHKQQQQHQQQHTSPNHSKRKMGLSVTTNRSDRSPPALVPGMSTPNGSSPIPQSPLYLHQQYQPLPPQNQPPPPGGLPMQRWVVTPSYRMDGGVGPHMVYSPTPSMPQHMPSPGHYYLHQPPPNMLLGGDSQTSSDETTPPTPSQFMGQPFMGIPYPTYEPSSSYTLNHTINSFSNASIGSSSHSLSVTSPD